MAYPFVQAYHDYGRRRGPVLAFVVHMAEGGGTVGYLSREQSRGVSVHYVIEYSGRTVQMLREDHASGSIDPTKIRTTNGPAPYGAAVRRKVMLGWDADPNSAVISLEIEGFARDGPNAAQAQALARLVRDVRSRYPSIGLLGHRDFADYKACPGAHIPWSIIGGHGPSSQEGGMPALYFARGGPGRFTIPAGQAVRGWRPTPSGWVVDRAWTPRDEPSSAHYSAHLATSAPTPPTSILLCDSGFFAGCYVSTAEVTNETPDPPMANDCEAAIAADRATARIVWD